MGKENLDRQKKNPLPADLRYVRLADVGEAVGRSRPWAYDRAADGTIPTVRLRGVGLRVRYLDAIAFLESLEESDE